MRILIIGGAGFIGSHLVRRCLFDEHEVHVVLRPSSDISRLNEVLASATVHRLSLLDVDAVRACVDTVQPSHIFYLAGSTGRRHDDGFTQVGSSLDEPMGLLTLVEVAAAAEIPPRCFVRTGSIAEYGVESIPFRETQREYPTNVYAAAIVAGTHYSQAIASRLPFPLITARLSLVYGTGQANDFLVPSLIAACVEGKQISLKRPRDRRDFVHVTDVVEALCRLAVTDIGSDIINIGSGEAVSVAELAIMVATLANADPDLVHAQPHDDPVTLQLCVERAKTLIGWNARIGLGDGIAALIAGHRRQAMGVAA